MTRTRRIGIVCLLSLLYCSNAYGYKAQQTLSEVLKNEADGVFQPQPIEKLLPFKLPKEKQKLSNSPINPSIMENGRLMPNKAHPEIAKLYDGLGQKISELDFDEEDKNLEKKKNGIDLALKQLAADFEKQFLAIMWQFASNGANPGHDFGDKVMNAERNNSIVEAGYDDDLGEMGQNIYEELRKNIFGNENTNGARERKYINRGFAKNIPIIHEKS
jgi:hypothetical protein